ncbi:hypothetical protein NKH80_24620 [Mesorhizobium sp. M0904]|uniref:hypothetical protein n=1 Tax=Mesorhizobium sp. M0904 TaxID=2957022 RepID=UPI00333B8026
MNEELLKDAIISEFAIVPDMIAIPTPTYEKYDNVQESGVRDLLIEVRSARRQEERIAILIAGILENRSVGISALLQYGRDKAKFANHALDRIRDTLIRDDGDDRLMEIAAEKLVRHLYSAQFPASRGSLLLFFAKYLAGWPEINGEIHRRLGRTRSMFVEQYRPAIEEFLKSPRIQSRDGPDLPLFRASLQSFPIE